MSDRPPPVDDEAPQPKVPPDPISQRGPAPDSPVRATAAKRRFSTVALVLVAAAMASGGAVAGYLLAARKHAGETNAPKAIYQCPMHPTIVQDHPGECPICGMKLVKVAGPTGASSAGPKERKIKFYRSPMNPQQTSPTPRKDEMGMDYVPVYEDEDTSAASTVEGFATVDIEPARQQLIGLKTAPVTRGKVSGAFRTFSRVVVDERRVGHINLKVSVYVEHVYVNFVGKPVRRGELLFSGYSPELLAAQAEYRVALKANALAGSSDTALDDTTAAAARRRLELWDMPEQAIKKLEQGGPPLRTLTFVSPIQGIVTKKDVVEGMKLEPGAMPYEVVDLSKVWVLADVYESDLQRVRVGMSAKLTLKAVPNRTFEGISSFIDPVLDPMTRTAKLRLEFPNPGGELRPGMFGEVTLESAAHDSLRIPPDAVIDSGTRKVVFVAIGDGKLQPREVVLGVSDGASVEVISGLSEGEKVVVRANFLVDSESQLRAALAALAATPPKEAAPPAGSTSAAPDAGTPDAPPHEHGMTMPGMNPSSAPSASASAPHVH